MKNRLKKLRPINQPEEKRRHQEVLICFRGHSVPMRSQGYRFLRWIKADTKPNWEIHL